jgi:hypothetical protein
MAGAFEDRRKNVISALAASVRVQQMQAEWRLNRERVRCIVGGYESFLP